MFNQRANTHQANQLLNPFSNDVDGRKSPRFSKEEYGRPVAGSLTEQRGLKANIHVFREMCELCEIINGSGAPQAEEDPRGPKWIFFGELFNVSWSLLRVVQLLITINLQIYVHVSDKVVGLLLRARKHKLVDFEGEILFQRRDDDVPIMMLKPMKEIREYLKEKEEDVRRDVSPNPKATTLIK